MAKKEFCKNVSEENSLAHIHFFFSLTTLASTNIGGASQIPVGDRDVLASLGSGGRASTSWKVSASIPGCSIHTLGRRSIEKVLRCCIKTSQSTAIQDLSLPFDNL